MAQQEPGQAVPGTEDVLALILASPQQVTHGLLGRCRHPYRRELVGAEQARELAGVEADVGSRMLEHGRRLPYVAPSATSRMIHEITQAPTSPC
jgi:hypothetical protein